MARGTVERDEVEQPIIDQLKTMGWQHIHVDQLRVRAADGADILLDLVLFVNGIPVAVVEYKSPDRKDPIGSAIQDLRAYAGVSLDDTREPHDRSSGVPEFFAPVQLLVAASGSEAALGTITSSGLFSGAPSRTVMRGRWSSTTLVDGCGSGRS
ncbi:hypothetical protein StrepF001_17470 [Streptomyces sp. F001]|uniref:type I restriction endonuclease n=1 Tax=Streptomyces sp. F001 TaxID=1510026 RepID=UPI00101E7965|nr:type I restriction endonuclease [Streptomyces sp. F001]RZB17634.1 hypothetical protein StrepF001_17470 [Streptomyces sp. F001]